MRPDIPRSAALDALAPRLPSTLALVIAEYNQQPDDYRALHQMCHALEITTRFLTVVVLAELWTRRAHPQADFPEPLLTEILRNFERPTLGGWRGLLEAAVKALPGTQGREECLVPQLPAYSRKFTAALGGNNKDPLQRLLPMRNLLAHAGRVSDEMVAQLLGAHQRRFEELIAELTFLTEDQGVTLVALPQKDPARLLRGASGSGESIDRSQLPEDLRQAGPDRMMLITPNGKLDLSPLHAYGEVFQIKKDQLEGQGEDAIQIYSRTADPQGVEYTALGGRFANSRGAPAWESRFSEIFALETWRRRFRTEKALAKYSFQDRIDGLLRLFVGRDKQVAAAATRIEAAGTGVFWLAGKPGMGKSAFMAKLARDYFQLRPEVIAVPYFFESSDADRCRTTSFAEAALLRIAQATGGDIRLEREPQKRLNQLKTEISKFAAREGNSGRRKIVCRWRG